MRIIEPSFKIMACYAFPLTLIENAGRTCYKSEKNVTSISSENFAKRILKRGHESVIEHASVTVRIICDRGVTHEIVRHRLASYSQESTRYCNYGKDDHLTFIKPCFFPAIPTGEFKRRTPELKNLIYKNAQKETSEDIDIVGDDYLTSIKIWIDSMFEAERDYLNLLKLDLRPEQARSILPNSLKTEIVMTANLREWRHFFKLRTAMAAHPQMREIARPMCEKFKETIPVVFDDIFWIKDGDKK